MGDTGVLVILSWGDGVYPVENRRDAASGRVAARRVTFIPE